jgi:hypothetical protein
MAIEGSYPSRDQSRWNNPLFARRRLRQASRAAIIAMVLVASTVGAWAVKDYGSAQARDTTFRQPSYGTPSRPQNKAPVARQAVVRLASLDLHAFSPKDNSSL